MFLFALTRARARLSSLLLATMVYASCIGLATAEPGVTIATANLEVDAHPECTTRDELITRVRARSPRVQFVSDGTALAIRVQIARNSSGSVAGEITLANPGAKPAVRQVLARSCTEAADAVALIIAVTLDPTSAEQHATPSTANATAVPAAAASGKVKQSLTGGTTSKSSAKRSASGAVAEPVSVPESSDGAPSRSSATFGMLLAAEAIGGVAPGVMPSFALFGLVGIARPSLWSPAAVLGLRHAWQTDVEEPGGSASFTLDAATLDLCPLRIPFGVVEARPCASVLFGRLSADGTETFNQAPESARPFWVVGGAAVVSADLASLLEVSGRLAVGANLVRDSFEFSPATFHTVPPISASASVGIGLRWR